MAETGQEHRELVPHLSCPLPRFRVPTFRVVEAVHLAVHAPDTERRRDTVRVAHLRRANPQQRLQNVQGFEIVAVILEVVGVRQQRGRDEPRILVGVDVDGVAHESLEVGRLGPDAT